MNKLFISFSILVMSGYTFAGIWFRAADNVRQGYWDDIKNWYTWHSYSANATTLATVDDVNIPYGHTVVVTGKTANCYNLKAFSKEASYPATVRVVPGGFLLVDKGGSEEFGSKYPSGFGAEYKYGLLDIQPGGTNFGSVVVGGTGCGIVTNAGVCSFGNMIIGRDVGSQGVYVHNDGLNWQDYPKDIYIGVDGSGELHVNKGRFNFKWYVDDNQVIGFAHIGCGGGTGTGLVKIERDAIFESGHVYLGGGGGTFGVGRVRMRGGMMSIHSKLGLERGFDSLWIGAAIDDVGDIRSGSYGEICGWGTIAGGGSNDIDSGYMRMGIYARLGNGAIIADGEGEERELDCSAMYAVTNVLFGAAESRSNGWYAVNKGAVIMPGVNVVLDNGGDNWAFQQGSNSVGCCRSLICPDLVNSVRIEVRVEWKAAGKNLGVMLLAGDRSDAKADDLSERYKPLGFWKAGVFDSRTEFTAEKRQVIQHAKLDFRYDHNKIGKSDSRLAVLRYSGTDGKWSRLNWYATQPENCIVSSGKFTEPSDDPIWGIGLFCVAEVEKKTTAIVIR